MTRHLIPALLSATALALGACGYSGQDEPNDSGANRLPEAEPPVSARETSPTSPQAGDTEAESTEGELEGGSGTEDETSTETGDEPTEEDANPYR